MVTDTLQLATAIAILIALGVLVWSTCSKDDGTPAPSTPAPSTPGAPAPSTPGAPAPAPSTPGAPAPSTPGAPAPAPSTPGAPAPAPALCTPAGCWPKVCDPGLGCGNCRWGINMSPNGTCPPGNSCNVDQPSPDRGNCSPGSWPSMSNRECQWLPNNPPDGFGSVNCERMGVEWYCPHTSCACQRHPYAHPDYDNCGGNPFHYAGSGGWERFHAPTTTGLSKIRENDWGVGGWNVNPGDGMVLADRIYHGSVVQKGWVGQMGSPGVAKWECSGAPTCPCSPSGVGIHNYCAGPGTGWTKV